VKRALILFAACLVLAAAPAGAQPPPPIPMGEGDYFPLQKGTTWTYQAGRSTIIVKVVGEEKIGNEMCSKLETSVNNMVAASEHVAIRKDGVYRCAVNGQAVTPPLCFLKLPPKKDATWDVNSTIATNEKVVGKFKEGEVELPAFWEKEKEKKDQKVKMVTVTTMNMTFNGQPLLLTYYFAPGVGIVQQDAKVPGTTLTLKLTGFTVPNPTP
jgi:hypothetical protein